MDGLGSIVVTENRCDLRGACAEQRRQLGSVIVNNPRRETLARMIDDFDRVAALELAAHLFDAGG